MVEKEEKLYRVVIDGVEFTLTQKEMEKYVAAHPKNSAASAEKPTRPPVATKKEE